MNRKYILAMVVAVGIVAVPFLAYAVMSSLVVNGNATIGSGYTSFGAPTDGLLVQGKLVVGSSVSSSSQVKVAGVIESSTGGFKFPDGTTQTTAVTSTPVISTVYTASNVASISVSSLDLDTAKVYRIVVVVDTNTRTYIKAQMNGSDSYHGYEVKAFNSGQSDQNSTGAGYWKLDGLLNANYEHVINMTIAKPSSGAITSGTWTAEVNEGSAIDIGEQDLGGGNFNTTANVTSILFSTGSGTAASWRVYVYSN